MIHVTHEERYLLPGVGWVHHQFSGVVWHRLVLVRPICEECKVEGMQPPDQEGKWATYREPAILQHNRNQHQALLGFTLAYGTLAGVRFTEKLTDRGCQHFCHHVDPYEEHLDGAEKPPIY